MSVQLALRFDEVPITCETQQRYHSISPCLAGRRSAEEQDDDFFFAEQNARLVKNTEQYYRSMFRGHTLSWNLRDRHMAETLDALVAHLGQQRPKAKIVGWEHDSHLGDARATESGESGQLNVGQLMRGRCGREAVIVGFTTYTGTVTAASDWDAPAERKLVCPALPQSYEWLFHQTPLPNFLFVTRENQKFAEPLREKQLERAIGVIYRPQTERLSHYFRARLSDQFDAVMRFDQTRAVEPLERAARWEAGELPETYPYGL